MSSHHIIKEKQEPALMIANGLSCNDEIMGQLLEWSPYILVLDGALDRVLMKGIKVDSVLGDFDSLNVQRLDTELEQKIKWLHTPNQKLTDFDKGLEFLIEEGHNAVNILWATGRRLDHTINNLISVAKYSDKILINLIDDHSRIFVLPRNFKKYYPAGTTLSLIPITDVSNIVTSGLMYNLSGEDFSVPNVTGTSNEVLETGIISINHEAGILFLMECTDAMI